MDRRQILGADALVPEMVDIGAVEVVALVGHADEQD